MSYVPRNQRDCTFPDGDYRPCAAHGGMLAYVADTEPVCDKSPLYEPELVIHEGSLKETN